MIIAKMVATWKWEFIFEKRPNDGDDDKIEGKRDGSGILNFVRGFLSDSLQLLNQKMNEMKTDNDLIQDEVLELYTS